VKLWVNVAIQVVAFIGQAINIWTPVIPAGAKPLVAMGLTTLQLAVAMIAHYSNLDGTPAQMPWQPAPKP
jgi:hypothetical protein